MRKQTGSRSRGWLSAVGNRLSMAAGVALVAGMMAGTARAQTEYFVATNGLDNGDNDGLSWAAPLLTISNGVAMATAAGAGSIVTVSNGTYNISTQITVNAAITVRSFGGGVYGGLTNAANTIVRRSAGSIRIFDITHASAVVQGLTIRDGAPPIMIGVHGGGVLMTGGLVQDCIVTNNVLGNQQLGNGVYMTGGTVSNCIVRNNSGGAGSSSGGGIHATGATGGSILFCQILDNSLGVVGTSQTGGGGGIFAAAGVVIRNCLIFGNSDIGTGGGGGVRGGKIESCTIVGNSSGGNGGGVSSAAYVSNSIVFGNSSSTINSNHSGTASFPYSCTSPTNGLTGAGMIQADPLFRDIVERNYQLRTGSPCIDAGDDTAVTWAMDLAGNPRKQDMPGIGTALVDMGAYEYDSALNCSFVGSPRYLIAAPATYQCLGTAPFTVQFTAIAAGTNLTGLSYNWDLNNDGVYDDATGSAPLYTFTTAGVYTPRLQVMNAVGEVAYAFKPNYVSAGATHYVKMVSDGGSDVNSPYLNWGTAAATIQAAVNVAANGATVIVSNGTYNISSAITFTNHIILRSFQRGLSGATNTVVRRTGGTSCVLDMRNAASDFVTVEGLTLTGGNLNAEYYANGLNMAGGLVRDCIVTENHNGTRGEGGIRMTGGTVSNCVISANTGGRHGGNAGGIAALGACKILDCNIYSNNANGTFAGGVYLNGASAVARNCRIALSGGEKSAGGTSPSRGVYLVNGLVENCTIVTNRAVVDGGGVYRAAGTVRNCIIYDNWVTTAGNVYSNYWGLAAGLEYSCTTNPVVAGTGCISDDPLFSDRAGGDYTLQKTSPCIDTGSNQDTWMVGAKDLAGNTRKTYGGVAGTRASPVVDMGAYEAPEVPPKGTLILMR
jgi:hypothetical protein